MGREAERKDNKNQLCMKNYTVAPMMLYTSENKQNFTNRVHFCCLQVTSLMVLLKYLGLRLKTIENMSA